MLVVSHDRSFLDNLCSSTLVFEGAGAVKEYVGGYSDWRRTVEAQAAAEEEARPTTRKAKKPLPTSRKPKTPPPSGRLTFRERKEWEELPGRIETMEEELATLHDTMAEPSFFKGDPAAIREATLRSEDLAREIEESFARWADLDERSGS